MAEDARPEGIGELVKILARGIREESKIKSIATTIDAMGMVDWDGDARDQWTSLVDMAAERPKMFTDLLTAVGEYLEPTIHNGKFKKWCEEYGQSTQNPQDIQSDHARITQAVDEIRKFRRSLLDLSDPRNAELPLQTMRLAIMEIKVLIEGVSVKESNEPPVIASSAQEAATAKSEIIFACSETLREVDQLTIDILAVRRRSSRSRREYSGQEALAAEQSMVRLLLNDRVRVDLESQALLEVIDQQLAHLRIPVPSLGPQRQAVPPPRPET
jgi:hypothetical protein